MKRLTLFLIMFCLIFALSACKSSSDDEPYSDNDLLSEDSMLHSQSIKHYPFAPGSTVVSVVRLDNSLMMAGANGNNLLLGVADYVIEGEKGVIISDTRQINLNESGVIGFGAIYGIAAGGDRAFYVLAGELPGVYTNGNNSTNTAHHVNISILKYTDSGELLERLRLIEWHDEIINGIAVGSDGEIIIYGSSYISLLNWNGEIVNTEYVDRNSFVLSVALCGERLIASVYEITNRKTHYFLINSVNGALSEFEAASKNDHGLVLGNWFGVQGPDTNLRAVSLNYEGFNRLGITSVTQGLGNEFFVNDGFRFFALNLDAGVYEKLYQWNYELDKTYSLRYVSRISETFFVYTVSNGEYLIVSTLRE